MTAEPRIRPLDPASTHEIRLVAERMRATLVEVLGERRGTAMYTLSWLEERVREHLDPSRLTGAVWLALDEADRIVGHTIVRLDHDDQGDEIGLFSTIYVVPEARRNRVAQALIARGEAWMRSNGIRRAFTYTAADNTRLHRLFERLGYEVVDQRGEMVRIARSL